MPDISFNKLGTNPEYEATLLRKLCSNDGIDDAIISEFPETIATYSKEPNVTAVARIADRYSGTNPLAVGDIIMVDDTAVGLAYCGLADYQMQGQRTPSNGINMSSWILSQYRRNGIGNRIINHAAQTAIDQSHNPASYDWQERRIWTSIKIGNIASLRACENAGFVESGVMSDDPNRIIYTLS